MTMITHRTSIDAIRAAQERISPYLVPTPLEPAPGLGSGMHVKLENANRTHSFKVRGALNAVLLLDDEARARGIVAASSGNHAQGLAYAAHVAEVRAKILMPEHTPRRKVNGVRGWGAEAVLFGATYDDAEAEARRLEREHGLTFISPYNDADIIAGAGTVGLEIVAALPEVARVVVCVSGGGLICGVAAAVKAHRPEIEVIGVNALSAPAMYNAFYHTNYPQNYDTLAEALSGDIEAGSITVDMARQLVDRIVLVDEAAIAAAMRWMLTEQGWLVEGGGAVGVAAVQTGAVAPDDRPTVIVVSGGNVDAETIQRIVCG